MAKKIIPFASLYFGSHHPDEMDLSRANVDLLCFYYNRNEEKPNIVVWKGEKAVEESIRIEELLEVEDLSEEEYYQSINYSFFLEEVCDNFDKFIELLKST